MKLQQIRVENNMTIGWYGVAHFGPFPPPYSSKLYFRNDGTWSTWMVLEKRSLKEISSDEDFGYFETKLDCLLLLVASLIVEGVPECK